MSQKIMVIGFPHSGTTILKSIIGHIEDVEEICDETLMITLESNKKFTLCKYPGVSDVFFGPDYDDYIKIFIIRNPLWVFSSLKKRFSNNIPPCHSLDRYIETLKHFIHYQNNPRSDVYLLKYEDMFDNNYQTLRDIFNSIGFQYSEKIFDNIQYTNKVFSSIPTVPQEKPDCKLHENYRMWQINQPFVNLNDESKITLTTQEIEIIKSNQIIKQIYSN